MEFCKEKWIGTWENFENYIYSDEKIMTDTWEQVEEACKAMPALSAMFAGNAKTFWGRACVTKTEENPVMLGGMTVTDAKDGITIGFFNRENQLIGEYTYVFLEILEKGLEGKENIVLFAEHAPKQYPFRYVLTMEPMPNPQTRKKEDLLSHFHFQFASARDRLILDGKLVQNMWYATMCQESSSQLEKCNVVRALHKMPMLTEE